MRRGTATIGDSAVEPAFSAHSKLRPATAQLASVTSPKSLCGSIRQLQNNHTSQDLQNCLLASPTSGSNLDSIGLITLIGNLSLHVKHTNDTQTQYHQYLYHQSQLA